MAPKISVEPQKTLEGRLAGNPGGREGAGLSGHLYLAMALTLGLLNDSLGVASKVDQTVIAPAGDNTEMLYNASVIVVVDFLLRKMANLGFEICKLELPNPK